MKKIILLFIFMQLLGCSSSDESISNHYINLKIDDVNNVINGSINVSDLKVVIYLSEDDYLNDRAPFFSGNFDNGGRFSLSNNVNFQDYFIDIYTDDGSVSNFGKNYKFKSNSDSDYFQIVQPIKGSRIFVGEWNFNSYDHNHPGHSIHDRTIRNKLKISKDYSVTSLEQYNNIQFTVKYKISVFQDNQIILKYISTSPSDMSLYPYHKISSTSISLNTSSIVINFDESSKMISFHDYADEYIFYKK